MFNMLSFNEGALTHSYSIDSPHVSRIHICLTILYFRTEGSISLQRWKDNGKCKT